MYGCDFTLPSEAFGRPRIGLLGRFGFRPATQARSLNLRHCEREGAEVRMALLFDYYRRLPERKEGEEPESWGVRLQDRLENFKLEVRGRYTEGSLQRLLNVPNLEARRAAVLALGLTGTMNSNKAVAARLHDSDAQVRQLASDALWAMWFRAGSSAHNRELQRITRMRDPKKALAAYDALVKKPPEFAEAFNQRAILLFSPGGIREIDRRLRPGLEAESLPFRGRRRHGSMLHEDEKAESRPEGIPARPANQPEYGRRRGNDPHPGGRAG